MAILLPTTAEYGSQQEQSVDAAMASITSSDDHETKSIGSAESHPTFIVKRWQNMTAVVHRGISYFVMTMSMMAARNPKRTISFITFLSFLLIAVGFFTNFNLQVDYEVVYAPIGSQPLKDKAWVDDVSGFPADARPFSIILHNKGNNVLGMDQVDMLFDILDTIRDSPKYNEICQLSNYKNNDGEADCKIFGPTRFWGHSRATFHEQVDSDEAAIETLSATTFPEGTPVYSEFLFGYAEREEEGELLTSAQSLIMRVDVPDTDGVEDFEIDVLNRLSAFQLKLQDTSSSKVQMSYFTLLSYDMEFTRAINEDLILVPCVVLIMSVFTCLVFYKNDRVQSRCLLGLCSVAAVGLCLMTGCGLMFLIGIPFTSMTQLLPFVVFGVGLDDCFIIMGAYFRTDPSIDPVERVRLTMSEVGSSISLTTITTMTAFILGCISSIPAIQWVCIYAVPTIAINFIYQCTFFISCLILDERRISANRKDCCICFTVEGNDEDLKPAPTKGLEDGNDSAQEEGTSDQSSRDPQEVVVKVERKLNLNEQFMRWYAAQLMKPWVKISVIAVFLAYFGFCLYCTTNLSQRFRTQDFVPEDSYVSEFLASWGKYSEQVMGIHVYFRGVNQSDPVVQGEMRQYMEDLSKMTALNGTKSPLCWVVDFAEYFEEVKNDPLYDVVKDLSFEEQVTLALSNPNVREAYGDDIVQDVNGNIVASRCWLNPKYLDVNVVSEQVHLLNEQRGVSLAQPVNKDSPDKLKFFTFDTLYFIWEFYAVAVDELIFTTISGIIAVCLVGFVLIEHRSATAFVFPMILLLYVDLLGKSVRCRSVVGN